ncbi:OLC1v1012337C1 [Oldenlandia corymbosa var. corymbosa]|uniref:OLC1v1012337C1 n=1 Tax=Oldenlandia corymbosa var. corymbosa TaxID=529605 RepID=A0AAV1DVQ8_OLDCO|nr:OLC1v1012337C1 [Oldenlandia corymbosa var. corymbosa]
MDQLILIGESDQFGGNQMLTDMPNQSIGSDSANQIEMNSIVFLSGHDQPGGKLVGKGGSSAQFVTSKKQVVTKGSSSLEKLFGNSRATSLLRGELAGRFVTGQQSNISKLTNVDGNKAKLTAENPKTTSTSYSCSSFAAYKSPNDNVSSSKPPSAIPKQLVVKVSSSQPTGSIKKQAALPSLSIHLQSNQLPTFPHLNLKAQRK